MAVTPNTTFTIGDVLTASQQNRFGRGIMATPVTSITPDTTVTAEEIQLTYTFSAVNGRMYLVTYSEPAVNATVTSTITGRIRETNLAGSTLNSTTCVAISGFNQQVICQFVYTATASASLTLVATLAASAGTATAARASARIAELYAIDIGAS